MAALGGEEAGAKIINGRTVTASDAPWHAALVITSGTDAYYCGGTLVSATAVVTAAHCTMSGSTRFPASAYTVFLSSTVRPVDASSAGTTVRVTSVIVHPSYNAGDSSFDVAVLRLASAAPSGSYAQLSSIGTDAAEGAALTVVGFGVTSGTTHTFPARLQAMTDTVLSPSDCNVLAGVTTSSRIICTRNPSAATCSGDSGGGLVRNITTGGVMAPILVGVVSAGGEDCISTPSLYSSVYFNALWIASSAGLGAVQPPSADYTPLFQPGAKASNAVVVIVAVLVPCCCLAVAVGIAFYRWRQYKAATAAASAAASPSTYPVYPTQHATGRAAEDYHAYDTPAGGYAGYARVGTA